MESAHGTLIIFSATKTSIIIAADSGLGQNGKIISTTERKIMPVGRKAACAMMGMAQIRFSGGKGQTNPLDVAAATRKWIAQHASLTLREVHYGLTEEFGRQFSDIRVPYVDSDFGLSLFCLGFEMDTPIGYRSTFSFQTETPPKVDSDRVIFRPGMIIPVATTRVATEILQGNSPALTEFKTKVSVTKYREARATGKLTSLTERDFLLLSAVCLNATESQAGRAFDPKAARVSAPNRFAVIDKQTGFRWTTLP